MQDFLRSFFLELFGNSFMSFSEILLGILWYSLSNSSGIRTGNSEEFIQIFSENPFQEFSGYCYSKEFSRNSCKNIQRNSFENSRWSYLKKKKFPENYRRYFRGTSNGICGELPKEIPSNSGRNFRELPKEFSGNFRRNSFKTSEGVLVEFPKKLAKNFWRTSEEIPGEWSQEFPKNLQIHF